MKLIIAGGRDLFPAYGFIFSAVKMFGITGITEVVSGQCDGVDREGEHFASHMGIHVEPFPYESEHGKAGGPIRNRKMAKYADALLLIWTGDSPGSRNMKEEMERLKKPIYEIILKGPNAKY